MRALMLAVIPIVFIVGLVIGVFHLHDLSFGSQACTVGGCPLALHEDDAGKTFVYNAPTRVVLFLDEGRNPQKNLHCVPDGVIKDVPSTLPAQPPLYTVSFEGVVPGTCLLSDDHFSATIIIR